MPSEASQYLSFVFSLGFFFGVSIFMSSWGSGQKFSNLQQVGDFSILGSKSVTFYFFLFFLGFFLWGFNFDVKLGGWVKIFKFTAGR